MRQPLSMRRPLAALAHPCAVRVHLTWIALPAVLLLAGCALDEPGATAGDAPPRLITVPTGGEPTVATAAQLLHHVQTARAERGLAPIATSPALDEVARLHVEDLESHYPELPCNLHSWSTDGPWTACCYTDAAPIPECMVNKPAELTDYPGLGFEIAVSVIGNRPITAERAVDLWLDSPPHRAVLLNQGTWADDRWRAVGVAITEHYAVVWFGRRDDLANRPVEPPVSPVPGPSGRPAGSPPTSAPPSGDDGEVVAGPADVAGEGNPAEN